MKRIFLLILAITLLISVSIPMPAMAWTNWDLEGWRIDAGKWMDGRLFTYYEGDWVPYRIEANGYDGLDTVITIQHDHLDANGHVGIDEIRNVFIGPTTDRTTDPGSIPNWTSAGDGLFDVSGPSYPPVPNGEMIEYSFTIPDPAALTAALGTNDFAFYWEAHLSLTGSPGVEFGSSYWNGASLHAHTSVTGNQDVPIKTPRRGIDIKKEFSLDGETWIDADIVPVPGDYNWIPSGTPIYIRIVVTNLGKAELTDIVLTDNSPYYVIGTYPYTYPSTLAGGDSFEILIGPFVPAGCFHTNKVTVSGTCEGVTFQDIDFVYYKVYST